MLSLTDKTEYKKNNESFLLPTNTGMQVIECANLVRIEAISNYSKLYFSNGKTLVVAKVLAWFEKLLGERGFVRLHRSHLVSIQHIRTYKNEMTALVILRNNEKITVSKRKKIAVKDTLHRFFNMPVPQLSIA
jgi:two-component system LytT family response regulator